MARQARLFVPGCAQLIRLEPLAGQNPFPVKAAFERFLTDVSHGAQQHGVKWHAYTLTRGQVVLLASAAAPDGVGKWIQSVNRVYVPWLNVQCAQFLGYPRSGPLWQPRFRSTVVEPGLWTLKACIWVDTLAVHSMMAHDPAEYPWSSYAAHIGLSNPLGLTDLPEYWALGNTPFERQQRYQLACQTEPGVEFTKAVADRLHKGWAVGSASFLERSEGASRRLAPARRGRPPKPAQPSSA